MVNKNKWNKKYHDDINRKRKGKKKKNGAT